MFIVYIKLKFFICHFSRILSKGLYSSVVNMRKVRIFYFSVFQFMTPKKHHRAKIIEILDLLFRITQFKRGLTVIENRDCGDFHKLMLNPLSKLMFFFPKLVYFYEPSQRFFFKSTALYIVLNESFLISLFKRISVYSPNTFSTWRENLGRM